MAQNGVVGEDGAPVDFCDALVQPPPAVALNRHLQGKINPQPAFQGLAQGLAGGNMHVNMQKTPGTGRRKPRLVNNKLLALLRARLPHDCVKSIRTAARTVAVQFSAVRISRHNRGSIAFFPSGGKIFPGERVALDERIGGGMNSAIIRPL